MQLFIGLGNPGFRYKRTRHNVGFQIIDVLSQRWGISLNRHTCSAQWGRGGWAGQEVVLAQPETYMNLSGRAVFRLLAFFQLSAADLLIIHDDLDLPLGRLKFVLRGGAGGHRGVASIINTIHTTEFLRLKVGIGRPQYGETVENYVLSPCYPAEIDTYASMIDRTADALEAVLKVGLNQAMSLFHGWMPPAENRSATSS
ncbi:aminoacyl-tRNA hydrolase [Desulfobacca acetoxidans]|uniref:Peptidyl-tRNA hydrolase n=1 Tax=Desulfobacca acetoxidans (strain ATCC 700848 / DSM 11109 / ASRB2) TaxID=880072 RepID=F2NCK5_DESAR|nr:aminoacyl-tRNA hydrolase [Desulfobacca acetoxidans]AEB09139.1 Peptidyl-tRNA hydrolase [Desulfobacca acetoxidans DSM 11109]